MSSVHSALMTASLVMILVSPVFAQPQYNRAFWSTYEKPLGKYAETTKCNACHYGAEKRNRNDYGQAFGKSLAGKQVKDAEKIEAALAEAAKQASGTPGKTFGELIEAGQLPGKRPQ